MTPDNCREIASEISAWFNHQANEGIPSEMMCEAFMMLPLCKWLAGRGYQLTAEYWNRQVEPYHAYDLHARGSGEVCLFDLKFYRARRQVRLPAIKRDLKHLAIVDRCVTRRYFIVCVCHVGFPDGFSIVKFIYDLLDGDDVKAVVVRDGDAVASQDGDYTTALFSVRPA